nr:N-formylglutamate amidohydrolase [uncultured Lichenicoccus sp.]
MLREGSGSPFVLASDHAGRAIPAALGDLGVAGPDLDRHIAWDIGIAGTGRLLGEALDAPLVAQAYSRLVIDCNRRPGHASSIPTASDSTPVPGNHDLSSAQRLAREREIFAPYHARLANLLDQRRALGLPTVLVALHSFTPQLGRADRPAPGGTAPRPWHVGLLHNHDPRFALILLALLEAEGDLVVGNNEPYFLSDEDDYTVPVHGEQRGLPQVEIEIRQDLIGDKAGEAAWAARLARLLPLAWARYQSVAS